MTAPFPAPLRLCVRRREAEDPHTQDRRIEISLRVPTDLEIVEEAVDLVARHCLASGLSAHAARFNLRVALCEALANAIVYGNDLDPGKDVQVAVCVHQRHFEVEVRDQGAGFDPGAVPDPTVADRIASEAGRGLFLIRQLMDEVHFNDRGNSICMIMRRA